MSRTSSKKPHQDTADSKPVPRAIEVGFPIVEINRLAQPERNSFKPIYQMHKWFARRASCVFRGILLGALKPAYKEDGTPIDLMDEFYKDHSHDPDTRGKVVLDPFMGGGTTVVEALRLGCKVIGIDLNPVAWFIVKTEVEPVDLDDLKAAYERLAVRPVVWNDGKPLRETLLDLYKTEVAPAPDSGVGADVIYTFWVKHAVCTDPTCKKEVPLFNDYLIAQKTLSVRYHRAVVCPDCKKPFDWEVDVASLTAEPALMVNAPRGSAGEGRPTAAWIYKQEPPKPKKRSEASFVDIDCPHCKNTVRVQTPWDKKKERKKVPLTVLLCPACEAVWQWRGALPDGEVNCPACDHAYDPQRGNVPAKGTFQCACGNRDKIIESIRLLPGDQRLPVRPYAQQAYLPPQEEAPPDDKQQSLFDPPSPSAPLPQGEGSNTSPSGRRAGGEGLLLPKNGKFFKRFSANDQARLHKAEMLWEKHKHELPYPKSAIPVGEKTKSGLIAHHYNHWHEMFAPRQLLGLSTLLQGVMAEEDEKLRELLLCAFSDCVGRNNFFCRYFNDRNTIQEIFSRHDYQPKITISEGSLFGDESIRGTYPQMFGRLLEGKAFNNNAFDWARDVKDKPKKVFTDRKIRNDSAHVKCGNSSTVLAEQDNTPQCIVTDPPYVGNVNYSELADFFYVWLRLALKDKYLCFAPEHTPKAEEIIENRIRGKNQEDFYAGLSEVFQRIHDMLPDDGLMVFTFHHTDQEGKIWEGLLQSLCDTGFEIVAIYPVHAESESSLHLMDKANVSYDLIHICRKREEDPTARSWAGIRLEVRRQARAELDAIEAGRYGNKPLSEHDVRLICIGKCLELYSAHYDRVLDHEGNTLPLHKALQDIGTIVDQLVTREQPLPPELEGIDSLTYVWLRLLMPRHTELSVDKLSKGARAMQVSTEELKKAGLITRGRTGRGRSFTVKQPKDRLEQALENLQRVSMQESQPSLFKENGTTDWGDLHLVDILHVLIALAGAGESVLPWIERFEKRRPEILAALRFIKNERTDWVAAIDRVIGVMEGAPLLAPLREQGERN